MKYDNVIKNRNYFIWKLQEFYQKRTCNIQISLRVFQRWSILMTYGSQVNSHLTCSYFKIKILRNEVHKIYRRLGEVQVQYCNLFIQTTKLIARMQGLGGQYIVTEFSLTTWRSKKKMFTKKKWKIKELIYFEQNFVTWNPVNKHG